MKLVYGHRDNKAQVSSIQIHQGQKGLPKGAQTQCFAYLVCWMAKTSPQLGVRSLSFQAVVQQRSCHGQDITEKT